MAKLLFMKYKLPNAIFDPVKTIFIILHHYIHRICPFRILEHAVKQQMPFEENKVKLST